MSTSRKCKDAGLKNLAELSKITQTPSRTLQHWAKNDPELFSAVLRWAKFVSLSGKSRSMDMRSLLIRDAIQVGRDHLNDEGE